MISSAAPFGPWAPDVAPVERAAQFRSPAALAAVMFGRFNRGGAP
jgi:hypothetical protein